MTWKQNEKSNPDRLYFVGCSTESLTEEAIWEIYHMIREYEKKAVVPISDAQSCL
ncbi:MAG: hypothetical protein LBS09_06060 [Bacteroidales bacterium]|jgi:hypothetical protein|nr:hypothetical protein [Bacteroidales bacterium]